MQLISFLKFHSFKKLFSKYTSCYTLILVFLFIGIFDEHNHQLGSKLCWLQQPEHPAAHWSVWYQVTRGERRCQPSLHLYSSQVG